MEMYNNPNLPQRDRICSMIDHVFGPRYGWTVEERVTDILRLLRQSLESYLDLRKVRKREITPDPETSTQTLLGNSEWLANPTDDSWQSMPVLQDDWSWAFGTTDSAWNNSVAAMPGTGF